MQARLHSMWQKVRQRWVAIAVTTAIIVIAITSIIIGYSFDGTGFSGYIQVSTIHTLSGPTAGTVTRTEVYQPGKTLWDWMQLLFVPVVLAVAGFWFNHREQKAAELRAEAEQEIEQKRAAADRENSFDNQHEAALKDYIDKMSELLLDHQLRKSRDEVRTIARVRTLTTLPRLDKVRKASILQFLFEAKLIDKEYNIIALDGADFSHANLRDATLKNTNLSGANFSQADLRGAWLQGADLTYAILEGADLREVRLEGADLSQANLNKANLNGTSLRGRTNLSDTSLKEANMSDTDLKGIILNGADMTGANLSEAYLRAADLRSADLSGANLREATLWDADLSGTNLEGADLRAADFKGGDDLIGANLERANLSGANLTGSKITQNQLDQAKSLSGTIMPDGSQHPLIRTKIIKITNDVIETSLS